MEATEELGGKKPGGFGAKRALIVAVVVVSLALIAMGVAFAIVAVQQGEERYQEARRVLWLARMEPSNVLYGLKSVDSRGMLLQHSLEAVKKKNPSEFDELVAQISDNLMGEDQVAFIAGTNSLGGSNAETLAYFNACLDLVGVDELPWPKNKDGRPYNGTHEVEYDREFVDVLHENGRD